MLYKDLLNIIRTFSLEQLDRPANCLVDGQSVFEVFDVDVQDQKNPLLVVLKNEYKETT